MPIYFVEIRTSETYYIEAASPEEAESMVDGLSDDIRECYTAATSEVTLAGDQTFTTDEDGEESLVVMGADGDPLLTWGSYSV